VVESRLDMSRLYLSLWDDNPTFHLYIVPVEARSLGGGDPFGTVLVSIGLIGAEHNTRQ
jgi:hypothetical protein